MTTYSSNDIFGYSWEDIQRAQQGGRLARTIDVSKGSDTSAEHLANDLDLLGQFGADGLREKQFFGVLGRLERAGLLP